MEKATTTMLVVLVIGGLVGAAGGYYYTQPAVKDAFAQGVAYQQSISTQTLTETAPDLTVTWDASDVFDHTATVLADGTVAAAVAVTHKLTIVNNGDTDANAVWISLYNPVKDKYGFDSDLETDYTKAYIDAGAISKITLYKEGAYLDGYELGTIPAGSEVSIAFTFEMLKTTHDTFVNGETYDCSLFIYGAGAPSVETLDFTVTT